MRALRDDVLPRLQANAPLSDQRRRMEADPHLPRVTLIFDREVRRQHAECKGERELPRSVTLDEPLSGEAVRHYEQFQGRRQARIEQLERALRQLKTKRRQTARQIAVNEFPDKDRFRPLRVQRRQFVDTNKMIAYRAETALAETLREKMARRDDARALPRQIFETGIGLIPDPEARTLTVYPQHLTRAARDAAAGYLCQELTAAETVFPGAELRMVYEIGSPRIP